MKLSILTTLYKTEEYIDEFYLRSLAVAKKYTDEFEIVFVDDGSPDMALSKVLKLHEIDKRVRVVELSRNFGHHKAIFAGLRECRGKHVFLLDSDLEEAPEWLDVFYPKVMESNVDCVVGIQKSRNGSIKKRTGGKFFYILLNWLSNVEIPANVTVARLMSSDYVKSLLLHNESEIFFSGICALTGYNQCFLEMEKFDKGETSYSLTASLQQVVSAVTSFSNKPLYIIFGLGCSILGVSFFASIWILIQKIFFTISQGYASLIVSIWAGVGVLLMSTGILGIYIAKIYSEVKRRPTIVKKFHE